MNQRLNIVALRPEAGAVRLISDWSDNVQPRAESHLHQPPITIRHRSIVANITLLWHAEHVV